MAVTTTTRFALHQWSLGSDPPVSRSSLDADNLSMENLAAGFLPFDIAANRPAASAANARMFFRASDTGAVSLSTGSAWFGVPIGTFLSLAGGTLTGPLDLAAQELRNPTVIQARDKVTTANISGSVTIDAAAAATHILTMTGNVTGLAITNLNSGSSLKVILIEDATGSRTIQSAFNAAGWVWPGGVASATAGFSTAANARNVLAIEKAGSVVEAYLAADLKA